MKILKLDGRRGVPLYHVVGLLLGVIASALDEEPWYWNLALGLGVWLGFVTVASAYYAWKEPNAE